MDYLHLQVHCPCGRKHKVQPGKRMLCRCGALVWYKRRFGEGHQAWSELPDGYGRKLLKRPQFAPKQVLHVIAQAVY